MENGGEVFRGLSDIARAGDASAAAAAPAGADVRLRVHATALVRIECVTFPPFPGVLSLPMPTINGKAGSRAAGVCLRLAAVYCDSIAAAAAAATVCGTGGRAGAVPSYRSGVCHVVCVPSCACACVCVAVRACLGLRLNFGLLSRLYKEENKCEV